MDVISSKTLDQVIVDNHQESGARRFKFIQLLGGQ